MTINLAKRINGLSELIAIMTAFYNAYLSWFKDEFSSFLLIITLVFVSIAILMQEYIKKHQNRKN